MDYYVILILKEEEKKKGLSIRREARARDAWRSHEQGHLVNDERPPEDC